MRRYMFGAAVLAVGATLCGPTSAQGKAATPLAINYASPNAIWWSIDVGLDKGFFKDAGFAPESIPFQNSPQAIQLLISKSAQIAGVQPESLMDANRHGADLVAIAQPESAPDWSFVVSKSIKTWSDIKGKTIGFSSLKVNEVWLTEKLLAAHGLTRSDWTGIQVGITPLKVAAIEKGSIAGAALFEPGAEKAIQGGLKELGRYAQIGAYPPTLVVATRGWATENNNGARVRKAFERAHQWLYDPANRAEAEQMLVKYTKVDAGIAKKIYEQLFITDKSYSRTGDVDPAGFKRALQLVADAGEIAADKLPAPESMMLPR
ncbi:MAG TPA: ABC transporter substrate-binding protein [Stellaceae bacterium]|nr:ABC transporter substrate-binding protein [Stellaceae bacterium]